VNTTERPSGTDDSDVFGGSWSAAGVFDPGEPADVSTPVGETLGRTSRVDGALSGESGPEGRDVGPSLASPGDSA
jgi:hypothetical protein